MDLRDLYITGAAEVDVGSSSRKAIIIHVRSAVSHTWPMHACFPASITSSCTADPAEHSPPSCMMTAAQAAGRLTEED